MPDQRQGIERFSHGEDGFWQDPAGLYMEFRDRLKALEAVERERDKLRHEAEGTHELLAHFRDERASLASRLTQLEDGLRGEVEQLREVYELLYRITEIIPGQRSRMHPEKTTDAELAYKATQQLSVVADRLQALLDNQEAPDHKSGEG